MVGEKEFTLYKEKGEVKGMLRKDGKNSSVEI